MKVVRLHGAEDLRLHDEPMPVPGPGDELIRVAAAGICGSDMHWYEDGHIRGADLTHPLVLAHESAGTIADGPRKGERVALDPSATCGVCEFCRRGHPNLCLDQRFLAYATQDGALQEYVVWPAHCLYTLPDTLTDVDGAMLEPLGIALHTVRLGHVHPGMRVSVLGCGPIGLLVMQVARVAGATAVYATEVLPHRMEAARRLGATEVFAANEGQEIEGILDATDGQGTDVVFECAGQNDAVDTGVAVARQGARLVIAGIPTDDRTSFTASIARGKGLTIVLVRRSANTYPEAIRLAESGMVDLRSIVSHRFPLEEYGRAFSIASSRKGLKVVVEP